MNLIEPILYQCKLNPIATAISTPGSAFDSVKYGQLEKLIHGIASSALEAGLAPRQAAAVFATDAILHAALVLGLMRLGIVTLSLAEPRIPQDVKIDAVVTDGPKMFPDAGNVIAVDRSWLRNDAALDYERCEGHDTGRIELTSGTTGRAKAVALTHRMLAERASHYRYAKGELFSRTSRLFCSFDIASAPGFGYLIYMLSQGGTIYFAGRDASAILQYIELYKVQALATSPSELEGLLAFFEADETLECSFDLIICQGASLSRDLSERARIRLCNNLYTCFEPIEASTVACGPAHVLTRTRGAEGFLCPGVTVDILDVEGTPLPPGREGSIQIRSPNLCSGYVGDPRTTAQIFRDGAFCSGDTGYVTADGMLVVTATGPAAP